MCTCMLCVEMSAHTGGHHRSSAGGNGLAQRGRGGEENCEWNGCRAWEECVRWNVGLGVCMLVLVLVCVSCVSRLLLYKNWRST